MMARKPPPVDLARARTLSSGLAPIWIDSLCMAPSEVDENIACRKRQFKTASGDTCADGHGGAEGRPMTIVELATWLRRFEDGDLADQLPEDGAAAGALEPGRIRDAGIVECKKCHCHYEPKLIGPDGICADCQDDIPALGPGDVKRGDIVRLNSGGPRMTVLNATESKTKPALAQDYSVECVWFTKRGKLQRETFHIHTLCLARD